MLAMFLGASIPMMEERSLERRPALSGRHRPGVAVRAPAAAARPSARRRVSRKRVVIAGLGDSGLLTAIRLARHADVVGISAKPALVSGQELGVRLARPEDWARDYWIAVRQVPRAGPGAHRAGDAHRGGPGGPHGARPRRRRRDGRPSPTTRWSSRPGSATASGASRTCSPPTRSAPTCGPPTTGWRRRARSSSSAAVRRRSAAPPTWRPPGRASGSTCTSPASARCSSTTRAPGSGSGAG